MASSFRLIERTGPNPGATFDGTQDVTTMGRDVTNEVVLSDSEVSRQHARITQTPGGYVLEDLGSTNGTFINGERLVAPRILSPGDLVGLGENVTLTFEVASEEATATVMAPAAGRPAEAAPTPARPAPSPPPAAPPEPAKPAAPAPAPAGADWAAPEQEGGGPRRWILAGCGCLVLLLACGGAFYFMDAYYPDLLYAPLRILGF
jgi:predicted component of type VI protein secretion system